MRRTIKREIRMDEAEVKEAITTWLKSKDIPMPDDLNDLYFASTIPMEVEVSWTQTGHFPPKDADK